MKRHSFWAHARVASVWGEGDIAVPISWSLTSVIPVTSLWTFPRKIYRSCLSCLMTHQTKWKSCRRYPPIYQEIYAWGRSVAKNLFRSEGIQEMAPQLASELGKGRCNEIFYYWPSVRFLQNECCSELGRLICRTFTDVNWPLAAFQLIRFHNSPSSLPLLQQYFSPKLQGDTAPRRELAAVIHSRQSPWWEVKKTIFFENIFLPDQFNISAAC